MLVLGQLGQLRWRESCLAGCSHCRLLSRADEVWLLNSPFGSLLPVSCNCVVMKEPVPRPHQPAVLKSKNSFLFTAIWFLLLWW